MAYQSLYRKYRSQTFSDLIGQDHVVKTLQNGISSGRIAHSYLFTGPRGTGKTSSARLLAKALCCEKGPTSDPCNECHICTSITAGACVDVIEMDAASESGVDDIREKIVEAVEYRPMVTRYKVFIIDEVHDLSPKAFDALLKTIEEPPEHIIFVLATTEYNKVPPTIRSRCQKFEFHRASMKDLVGRLNHVAEGEGVTAEPQAISAIARMADGGYRDALTLLEQAILTSEDGHITQQQVFDQLGLVAEDTVDQLLVSIREADVPGIMNKLAEITQLGRDPRAILESMLYRLADLTRAAYQMESESPDAARNASLHETATRVGKDTILRIRSGLAEAHKVIRDITLPRLWLESELVRLATMPVRGAVVAAEPARVAPPREAAPVRETAPREAPVKEAPVRETPPLKVVEGQVKAPAAQAPAPRKTTSADAWHFALETLMAKSKILHLKVSDARATRVDAGCLLLEFPRKSEHEWVTSKPAAMAMIHDAVQAAFGDALEIRYEVNQASTAITAEPSAVELPAEGSRLEQLAKEVFGLRQDSSAADE